VLISHLLKRVVLIIFLLVFGLPVMAQITGDYNQGQLAIGAVLVLGKFIMVLHG